MANGSIYLKWLIALVVIAVLLFVVYYYRLPEKEEKVTEQVEEIEWQDIDKVVIIADDEINIVKNEGEFQVIKDDTTYRIEKDRVHSLFKTFNKFQQGTRENINFSEWSETRKDSSAILLELYHNTEEVLNLYIYPRDRSTYYRYLDSKEIFSTHKISKEQFEWLDSLSR